MPLEHDDLLAKRKFLEKKTVMRPKEAGRRLDKGSNETKHSRELYQNGGGDDSGYITDPKVGRSFWRTSASRKADLFSRRWTCREAEELAGRGHRNIVEQKDRIGRLIALIDEQVKGGGTQGSRTKFAARWSASDSAVNGDLGNRPSLVA